LLKDGAKENLKIKLMTIKTLVTETKEREVELELPAFFKDKLYGCALGIIDEDDVYKIYHTERYSSIQSGTTESMRTDLQYATEENRITEEEFFDLYEKARKATDLNPRLVFKSNSMVDDLKDVLNPIH
jgi:hypothetical protein